MKLVKRNYKILLLGIVISPLSGCVDIPVSMSSSDLQQMRHNHITIIATTIHGREPKASVETLISGAGNNVFAAQSSLGHDLAVENHIEDPSDNVLRLLVSNLKMKEKTFNWDLPEIKSHKLENVDRFDNEAGDITILDLNSNGWHLIHSSISPIKYKLKFNVTAQLINHSILHSMLPYSGPFRTVWQSTCRYQSNDSYSLAEYKVNEGALIKLAISKGASYCAKQLASSFENGMNENMPISINK